MGMIEKVFNLGKQFDVSTVSGREKARSQLYMVRRHYADPDQGDDGKTDCPLYYGSIEGLCGSSAQRIAALKQLPKKGADETYRMISPFNVVPKMIETDLSCLVHEFSWDRLEVHENGTKSDILSEVAQAVMRQAEAEGTWTLYELAQQAGAAGCGYTRIKPDPTLDPGVRLETALAEGVYPTFEEWQATRPESFRLIHKLLPAEPSTDASASPLELGDVDVYVERVDAEKVEVWKNNALLSDMSGPHPAGLDEIPMVHVAYRESSRFFGIPCADSEVISAIDDLNVEASNLKNVLQGYGHPILLLMGLSEPPGPIEWGRRLVKGLPAGADAKMLAFENVDPLMKTIDQKWSALRSRVVQFILDELRSGGRAESGIALKIRLYPYDTWLAKLENQFTKAIQRIVRIALKILGLWPQGKGRKVEIKLDWGGRFPEDIEARLKLAESRMSLFGKIPEVLKREAMADGYDEKETEAILAAAARKSEADLQAQETLAAGGGLIGAKRAVEARERKQLPAPSGNIASPKTGQPPEPEV